MRPRDSSTRLLLNKELQKPCLNQSASYGQAGTKRPRRGPGAGAAKAGRERSTRESTSQQDGARNPGGRKPAKGPRGSAERTLLTPERPRSRPSRGGAFPPAATADDLQPPQPARDTARCSRPPSNADRPCASPAPRPAWKSKPPDLRRGVKGAPWGVACVTKVLTVTSKAIVAQVHCSQNRMRFGSCQEEGVIHDNAP